MSKIEIDFWDVEIKFRVRKGSYSAKTKAELMKNIKDGIGGNDMECINEEDVEVVIKC